MNVSIPELLINDGFITKKDRENIDNLSASTGLSFIKIALNFGYISRKNYERSLGNAGYVFQPIRELPFDENVLKNIELKFADQHVALPLYIKDNKVVIVMADPTNQLFIDYIRFTYDKEPEIIIADDLEIVWLSHKLLGIKYVKTAVFGLLRSDPDNSALITFTTPQLLATFISIGLIAAGWCTILKS